MTGTLTRIISPIPLEHPTSLLPIFWTIASTRPVRILPTLDGARTDHHHLRIPLCPSILILLPRALVVCPGHPVPSFRLTALIHLWNPHTEHSMCHTTIFPISNHGAQRTFLPAMLHTYFRPPPMATTSKPSWPTSDIGHSSGSALALAGWERNDGMISSVPPSSYLYALSNQQACR
jgi:hypothetical protein